jgi:RHS repeat-associated protein
VNVTSPGFVPRQCKEHIARRFSVYLAEIDGEQAYYQDIQANADALGTRRAQTDYAGVLEQTFASLPFGNALTADGQGNDATEHHFNGKERDTESGLDYFGARYYGSSMGRFMSPDWSAKQEPVPSLKLDNPQTLNLYSYVQNNPLSQRDFDGHASGGSCAADNSGARLAPKYNGEFNIENDRLAQQQSGDPTLPTEVQAPPPSLADGVETALFPKTPLDLALLVGTDGLGELAEAGAALLRVTELASAMGKTAGYATIAVTETKEGVSIVSSREARGLRPAVQAALKPGEVSVKGIGHAETTGLSAAKQMGLTPTGVAASRCICQGCWDAIKLAGAAALSALKNGVIP